jgi:hypothetical protein
MQDSGGNIWKNSSPALNSGTATRLNPLSDTSISQIQYEAPAIFTSGNIIATNNRYSKDAGNSWVTYKPQSTNNTLNSNSAGFNTGVAFNPANGYVLAYYATQYEGKAGYRASVQGYTGTGSSGTSMPTTAGRQPRAICYSPILGAFYLANNNGETWRISGSNLGIMTVVTNTGSPQNYLPFIDKDGYYCAPFTSSYRRYLTDDLSSYESMGGITGAVGSANYTAPIWSPYNGRYYIIAYASQGGGPTISFYESTNAVSWTFLSSMSTSAQGYTRLSLSITANNTFYVGAYYWSYYKGWNYYVDNWFSGDAGYSWYRVTNPTIGNWLTAGRNLTV